MSKFADCTEDDRAGEYILRLMADGRERTKTDMAASLPKLDWGRAGKAVDRLSRAKKLSAEYNDGGRVCIYKIKEGRA